MTDHTCLVVPAARTVVGTVGGIGEAAFREANGRLASLYGSAWGTDAHVSARWLDEVGAGAVVVAPFEIPAHLPDFVLWGAPVGASTAPPAALVAELLQRPDRGRDLGGVWVALGLGDAVDAVSSPTLVQTLKRVDHQGRHAVATKGLAAHVLAGRRPSLATERIPEFVLFSYVTGDRELLEDSRVLPPASTIRVGADGLTRSTWADRSELTAPGPTSSAVDLREAVSSALADLPEGRDVRLGLTSGRDSALVASCAGDRASGRPLRTFTMGWDGLADVDGARAQADALGWSHEIAESALFDGRAVRSSLASPTRFDAARLVAELRRWVPWTEGLDHPRNALAGWLRWDARDVVWLSGHGGETGRAFYWKKGGRPDDVTSTIVDGRATGLQPSALEAVRGHVAASLDEARADGWTGWSVADAFYCWERMRKWVGRGIPIEQIDDVIPLYLDPRVLSVLLNLPEADRRTASAFDDALAAGRPNLHHLARRATRGGPVRRVLRRGARRAGLVSGPGPWDAPLFDPLVETVEPTVVLEAMGEAWWQQRVAQARGGGTARLMIWNAIGVEVLASSLSELDVGR